MIRILNMEFKDRLQAQMKAQGLSASDLSKATGVSKGTVSFWVNGVNGAKGKNLMALAKALKCSPDWLSSGTGPRSPEFDANVEPAQGPVRFYEYPEISWVQAGKPMEAVQLWNVEASEKHPSDAWAGENGYWLRVRGPSMTSQGGISFIEGMVILVAPDFDVETGNYCVARLLDSNEATFKQFIWDSGRAYLKPLNPTFPTVEVDDTWEVIGKVVDAKWPRSALG